METIYENEIFAIYGLIKLGKKVSFNNDPVNKIKFFEVNKMMPYNYKIKYTKSKRIQLKYAKLELEFLKKLKINKKILK